MGKATKFGADSDLDKHMGQSAPLAHETPKYFHRKGAFIDVSAGAGDAGKPIKLDSSGKIDSSMLPAATGGVPVGCVIAYFGGYFTGSSNEGFTMVMASANTIAAVNTLLNPDGWYVCDGSALNDPASPIFNGAGRYLPQLTDDRFLMGDASAGGTGGENANNHTHSTGTYDIGDESAHTHGAGTLATSTESAHTHGMEHTHGAGSYQTYHRHYKGSFLTQGDNGDEQEGTGDKNCSNKNHAHTIPAFYTNYTTATVTGTSGSSSTPNTGAGSAHNHPVTGDTGSGSVHTHTFSGDSGTPSDNENRPKFLSCFYIMRTK